MSVESYGFKFVVDAKDAAKGYGEFQKAVDGVFDSLSKFEAHAKKTMDSVTSASKRGKSDIAKYAGQFKDLARLPIDATAAKKIDALGASMKAFRAPNTTQIDNLRKFYRALVGTPNINASGTARSISGLSAAMAGFKAPSKAQADRLREFAKAAAGAVPAFKSLRGISGVSGIANELATISLAMRNMKVPSKASIANLHGMANALRSFNFSNLSGATGLYSFLAALRGFRAPSPAQVRNLQSFITAVSGLTIPRNGAQVASVLEKIARAASAAQLHLRGFRGSLGGMPWGSFNAGARQASLNMMGLQNAFSASYQLGSALRTLLGSLTIGELGRQFFEANNRVLGFNAAMTSVVDGQRAVTEEFKFASDSAMRFGLDLGATMDGYKKVRISADLAGASVAQTRDIFSGLAGAMTVLGTATDRQNDVWLAVQQVMNKGYLASEELNQQLNEHLPGAMGILRNEVTRLGKDFDEVIRGKMLNGTQALLLIAKSFREKFGPSLEEALKRPSAQMSILRTNIQKFYLAVGQAGANDAIVKLLQRMNNYFTPEKVDRYANAIGKGLIKAVDKLSSALDWLEKNWDKIKGPLATTLSLLGKWLIISGSLRIVSTLVSPVMQFGGALITALPHLRQFVALLRTMTTLSVVSPLASGGGAALAGGWLTAANAINRVKLALKGLSMGGVFNALRNGFTSLVGPANTAGGAILRMGGWIAAGFMGTMAAARKAAKDSGVAIAHDQYTTGEIVYGMWLTVSQGVVDLWNWIADTVGPIANEIGRFVGSVFAKIGDIAAEVALGIAFFFTRAFQAIALAAVGLVKGVGNQFSLLASAATNFMDGNWSQAGKDAFKMMTFQGVTQGIGDAFKGFNAGGYKGFKMSVGQAFGGFSNLLATFGEKGRKAMTPTTKPKPPSLGEKAMADMYATNPNYDPSKLIQEGKDKDGKGKKGPKPKTQDQIDEAIRRAQEKLDNAVDDIMRRIAEDDPVRKVMVEHIKDVSEEAQALLNNDAYSKWIERVNNGSITGTNASASLIEALHGTGVETNVLERLEARYGVTKSQLIDLIRRQADETERNISIAKREKQKKEEERIFGFNQLKAMREEMAQRLMTDEQKEISSLVQEAVNSALDKGTKVTWDMVNALTAEAQAIQNTNRVLESRFKMQKEFFENNGIRGYLKDIDSLNSAVQNADRNFFQNFEDTLFRLGTEGKLSFKGLIDGIQSDIIRFASQQLTKSFLKMLFPSAEDGKSSIFGGLFGMIGGGKFGPETGDKSMNLRGETPFTPMFVSVVNPNGDLGVLGGGLGGALGSMLPGAGNSSLANPYLDPLAPLPETLAAGTKDGVLGGVNSAQPGIAKSFTDTFKSVAPALGMMLTSAVGGAGGGTGGAIVNGIVNIGLAFLTRGASGGAGGGAVAPTTQPGTSLPGIYKEGGIVGRAVSSMRASPAVFYNAPHYAEGTANTSGGHPAILHDNEAVIPLSRGRKVAVELTGESSRGNGGVTVHNNFNIQSPDADSFRKSRGQIATDLHMAGQRSYHRNRG